MTLSYRRCQGRADPCSEHACQANRRSYCVIIIILSPPFRPPLAARPLHPASASLSEGRQPVTLVGGASRDARAEMCRAVPGRMTKWSFACAAPARPASSAGHPGGFGTRPGGTTAPARGARCDGWRQCQSGSADRSRKMPQAERREASALSRSAPTPQPAWMVAPRGAPSPHLSEGCE
jgi:hypothetical protein